MRLGNMFTFFKPPKPAVDFLVHFSAATFAHVTSAVITEHMVKDKKHQKKELKM